MSKQENLYILLSEEGERFVRIDHKVPSSKQYFFVDSPFGQIPQTATFFTVVDITDGQRLRVASHFLEPIQNPLDTSKPSNPQQPHFDYDGLNMDNMLSHFFNTKDNPIYEAPEMKQHSNEKVMIDKDKFSDKALAEGIEKFIKHWQNKINNIYQEWYPNLDPPIFEINVGKSFVKVMANGERADAFIALKDGNNKTLGSWKKGDIFKPASWSSPAKHSRGNVFSNQSGMESIDKMGFVKYI